MRDTRDPSNTLESLPACRASRPRRGWVQAVLLACAAGALPALSGCAGQGAKAATEMLPNESVVRVPVQVDLENGGQARGELVVTVFTPQGEGRHPLMVISHGRAGDAAGRAKLGARALRRRPAISPTPVSSWPCRCGWVTAPPAVPTWKTAALRRPALYAHVQPCRERDRAGDRGDGAAAGRGSGQRGGRWASRWAAARPWRWRRPGRPACAPPSISRAVRAGIRSNRLASPAGPSACRKPMPATLRPPACPCSGSIPRTTCTGAGMAATLGRGLQRRRRPCAIRTPGAGRRQRPFAVHACPRNGSRWCDFLRAQGYAMPEPGAASGQARRP